MSRLEALMQVRALLGVPPHLLPAESIRWHPPLRIGQHVYCQDPESAGVIVVLSGCLKGYEVSPDGEEKVMIFFLPGDVVWNEGSAAPAAPASIACVERSEICSVSDHHLHRLMAEDADVQYRCLQILSRQIHDKRKLLNVLARGCADSRIAWFLHHLWCKQTGADSQRRRISIPMYRAEIASYLCMSLETVSRTLSRLRRESVIAIDGKHVIVLDLATIEAMATLRPLERLPTALGI